MANQRNAGSVCDYVVAACEQVEFIERRPEQCEFEQRAGERHWRALDRCRYSKGFLHGLVRAAQVVEGKVNIRVINRPLENLAILLKEGGPGWFGLSRHSAYRPLKGITLYRAVDPHKEAKLPLRTEATRFVRKPYIQLSASQRKCPVIKLHRPRLSM
jgi:hypothetical protein